VVSDPEIVRQFAEKLLSQPAREDRWHGHCVICEQTGHITGHRADGSLVLGLTYAEWEDPEGHWSDFLCWPGSSAAGVRADDQSHCYPLSRETVRWLHDVAASRPKLWGWRGYAPSGLTSAQLESRLSNAGFQPVTVFWYGEGRAASGEPGGQPQESATRDVLVFFAERPEHEDNLESAVLGTGG
jgi:hypothetical protein